FRRRKRWLWLRWRRVKRLHRSIDGLHNLRLIRLICSKGCDSHVRPAVRPVAHRAEKPQPAAEHDDEKQEFATAGFEEVQEVARFHGLAGVCLALGAFEGERADRPAVFCNSAIARRRAWRATASRSGVIPVGGGGDGGGGG